MCVVSMVMDHYWERWNQPPYPQINPPYYQPIDFTPIRTIPQADIDEFYRLLERAREYDRKHNEPDCEIEEKKQKIRELFASLGLKLDL